MGNEIRDQAAILDSRCHTQSTHAFLVGCSERRGKGTLSGSAHGGPATQTSGRKKGEPSILTLFRMFHISDLM